MRALRPEQEQEISKRHAAGERPVDIAISLGVGKQTVYNILGRLGRIKKKQRTLDKKVLRACQNGASIAETAARIGVSTRTVDRVLKKRRTGGKVVTMKRGRLSKSRIPYMWAKRKSDSTIVVDQDQIDEIYARLRHVAFPYPEHYASEKFDRDVSRLRQQRALVDDSGVIRPWSHLGVRLCTPFFPNRFEARSKGTLSVIEGWADERTMRRAIRFQLRHGDPVAPHRVLRAVALLCRMPMVFRPSVAQFVYRRYGRGGAVWDPCAGYGGRLLGAYSAGVHYIGTDVESATIYGNRQLAERLGANNDLVVSPAETFDPPSVDLVFTSPPYFDREQYSESANQSWKKHGKSLETWIDGFLRPVITRARAALRKDGHLILNVADLRERGGTIPIVDRTIAVALESGFLHAKTLHMPLAAINRTAPSEPLLVFKPR